MNPVICDFCDADENVVVCECGTKVCEDCCNDENACPDCGNELEFD